MKRTQTDVEPVAQRLVAHSGQEALNDADIQIIAVGKAGFNLHQAANGGIVVKLLLFLGCRPKGRGSFRKATRLPTGASTYD